MGMSKPLFRPEVESLTPYQPGRPVEDVQRELGLERVVKLASNEGPFPPFPSALTAISSQLELNRYPDGGSYRLHHALAERHGVHPDEICVGSGADGCLDILSQAALGPGDNVVCGWPSFASYPIYAAKQGASVTRVPLRDHRYDLDALADAIGPQTKFVYVCMPNNPTGTTNTRTELATFLDRVPDDVLPVIDQAYFEYVDDPEYPDVVAEHFVFGRRVVVLRTFSKIYGLAGLRVGYAVGPRNVCEGMAKVRRPFDITTMAQVAALASLEEDVEVARRREQNTRGRAELIRILERHGLGPAAGAVANFVYVDLDGNAATLFERLLREGVIIRPLAGFGAPEAVRISVGTPDELEFLDAALGRIYA
jgi:histidinol-phosphate aminotransferase